MQTTCLFGGPVMEAAASACSLAAAQLYDRPFAAKASGLASGALWLGGAIANELGNAPYSKLVSAANLFNGAAGAMAVATPVLFGLTQRNVAYGSAMAWAANGVADIACAAGNRKRSRASRVLQGLSGTASIVAAGLSAEAVAASGRNDSARSAHFSTAAGVLWAVGAAAALGAESVARFGPAPALAATPEPHDAA